LGEKQRLDPVFDAQLVLHEVFALAVRTLGVLFVWRGYARHTTHMPVTAMPGGEHAQHTLSIEPVCLGATCQISMGLALACLGRQSAKILEKFAGKPPAPPY